MIPLNKKRQKMVTDMKRAKNNAFAILEIESMQTKPKDNTFATLLELLKSLEFSNVLFYDKSSSLFLDNEYNSINKISTPKNIIHSLQNQSLINLKSDFLYCFTSKETWSILNKKYENTYYIPEDTNLNKQKKYLTESLSHQISDPKEALLELVKLAKRYKHLDSIKSVPMNGIYLLFEKGEQEEGIDRVVRVGTHTGTDLLPARLNQHYEIENKDRSIFRTNLGRALLNDRNDSYLNVWSRNNTTRKIRAMNLPFRIIEKEVLLEKEVSNIIQNNFSFSIIEVQNKDYRLYLETALIASFAYAKIKPSQNWLGHKSPVKKIRESGLWQVQGILRTPINAYDLAYIKDHLIFL